ncbi:MAG TPA: outer membrane beta-barrel protein [Bacteroidota bacterium]|nr:outer membrane beta-barrel protein [Bacteroidota bacterium]
MECYGRRLWTLFTLIILAYLLTDPLEAQQSAGLPVWWYGGAVGPNLNSYSSSVQQLNSTTRTAQPFTGGSGAGTFLAPMIEYRPNRTWGGMLSLGFDGRSGSFDNVGNATLKTSMNYISLEPNVRYSPFDVDFYFFGGPRLGFNVAKTFTYTPSGGSSTEAEWSGIRSAAIGIQLGAGYEFSVTPAQNTLQIHLSPFVSGLFGQGPRSEESWSLVTLRAGLAVLFGNSAFGTSENEGVGEVQFSARPPRIIPNARTVRETFPMRNYVFFDEGSNVLPSRYVTLTKEQALTFKEEQLLHPEPKDLTGRSRRQMVTYHNILNVLGDRMRRYTEAKVTLLGSAEEGATAGQSLAETIKQYLVSVFGIDPIRITTQGAVKPPIPSHEPGGTRDLELVKPEDRRVEISSSVPEILDPVQIVSLEEDPLESDVFLNVPNAETQLASWTVAVNDEQGAVQRYGPFTSDQARIPGRTILGNLPQGTFTLTLEGQTKSGGVITKEQTIRLVRSSEPEEAPGYRFSILFEFDQSKTVATYERFLTETVAPLIADGNSVIIHGHTDIVGEESHNLALSRERAQQTMAALERELTKAGKTHVKFDTYGFGEDVRRAPFDNKLPEERFYNRTVIIDIVPE